MLDQVLSKSPLLNIVLFVLLSFIAKVYYRLYLSPLARIPGPRWPAASSLWIRWQRWNGRLSFSADDLLSLYGSIIRIAPNLVLVNDPASVNMAFAKSNFATAPKSIRALRVGGHDWTVTYPELDIARPRRHPVMRACTTQNLRTLLPVFERAASDMVSRIREASERDGPVDLVEQLRITTLHNSQIVIGSPDVQLDAKSFPKIVGEYNFLVVWRLCLPAWTFEWLRYSPWGKGKFRVESSDQLFKLGEALYRQAEATAGDIEEGVPPSVYQLFTKTEKAEAVDWTDEKMSAEMAGQILAATETTSSALAFIFYELAKNPGLSDKLYNELQSVEGNESLDGLKLLDACIKEGLRFRPPVALTGSRVVGEGGISLLGHFLPEGTVVTTQALSICRQRPDLFPNADRYDPIRWLDSDLLEERRRLLVPFGVGTRRCPGGNLAIYQMRLLIAALVREFKISLAPRTTPEAMAPFEANGFRSRHDRCDLVFEPRTHAAKEVEFGWCPCLPSRELMSGLDEKIVKPAFHP